MDNNMESVPFKVLESVQARADRREKLMKIFLFLMLLALIGTNIIWILL